MKIGLIGAPGSGKTALAQALAIEIEGHDPHRETYIVDHYVDNVEDIYHIATGPASTYITNLMILAERLGQEHYAKDIECKHVITCGTLVDTAAHELVNTDVSGQENIALRAYNVMHVISTLILDTWAYDHVFYLPLRDSEREFHKAIDQALPEILAQTQCPHHAIVSDTPLKAALEVINADANVPV